MVMTPKEIVADWILVTYDIEVKNGGLKVRHEFLKKTRALGAMMHTESVYFMPWTEEANAAINGLNSSDKAKVYAWYTKPTSESQLQDLTALYDRQIDDWLEDVSARLPKIRVHVEKGHDRMVQNMVEKTEDTLRIITEVILRRGSVKLFEKLTKVRQDLAMVEAPLSSLAPAATESPAPAVV